MRSIRDLKSQQTRLTMLGLTAGAVLISFSGVWVKVAHVMPNVSAFYRVLIGGVALLAAALYRRELIGMSELVDARAALGVDPDKTNPVLV